MLLPETEAAGAFHVAEQVRLGVLERRIRHEASELGCLTVSLGVATLSGSDPELSPRLLLGRADEALYLAKDAGRDRTEIYARTGPMQASGAGSAA